MEFIDEKGKLFGLINIIDLIALILILSLVGAVGYKTVGQKINNPGIQTEQKDIYITVKCRVISEEACMALTPGDRLVSKNAFATGEVVSVSYDAADYSYPDSDGNIVLSKHPIWKDATVVLKDKANPSSPILKVGGQEARVGFQFIVKTQSVEIVGQTIGLELK